ncbi:MarR family transcriptional regulator [Blastopirellula sp. JC732]|uniref:MarR family transcriptional regulator n=1 Tax=Blastopirellula sediminis TaxID=2894196 RepID=A0A9X1MTD6_9BACT|nr:MarR family transcriptional regulator [Blastopirellula sediminis]MCC9604556.1 MarR family transcriptional regulator [Blastopirellula sediminis]MCC9632145.1 MarR family transcriptional regulator [Blastopirellula sediminis]
MLEYDFHNSISHWVCSTAHLIQREMNAALAPRGITFRQAQVLGSLALEGNLSQVELADRMGVEPPSLVAILDRMERDGLIQRQPCPKDRRIRRIAPRTEVMPMWEQVVDTSRAMRARITRGMTPEQVTLLDQLLTIVRQNLKGDEKPDAAATTA